jgi:SNF2 family DNA or RNA helicase
MWKRGTNGVIHIGKLEPDILNGIPHQSAIVQGLPAQCFPDKYDISKFFRMNGYPYPSMADNYAYPGPFNPMYHQSETVKFLLDYDRAYVANGLGTGKTLSALWAADCLMDLGQVRRVLIVAPVSAMWNAWVPALSGTIPNRRFKLLKGTARKKTQDSQDLTYKYLIVNPESLHIIEQHLPMVDLVIADESTKFKTWKAKRTQALYRICKERKIWMMSATPAPQDPTDAYAQIRIIKNGKYMSYMAFRDMTMLKLGQFKWVPRYNAVDIIARELQPCIRFSRDECLDLPDLSIIDHKVPLSPEQENAVKSLQAKAVAEIAGTQITAVNAGVIVSKILQVQSGAVYGETDDDGNKEILKLNASSVMESIEDIIEGNENPVIVYVSFRSTVTALVDYLSSKGIAVAGITADVAGAKRQEIFEKIQKKELKAVVAVASTISHGVTLTASDTIIWATPPVSFETYDQANGRIYRKGQTKKCVIYRLYYDAFSNSLLKRLDKKISLQESLLQMLQDKTVDILAA